MDLIFFFQCADDRKKLISAFTYLAVGFLQLLYWCGFGNELSFQVNKNVYILLLKNRMFFKTLTKFCIATKNFYIIS